MYSTEIFFLHIRFNFYSSALFSFKKNFISTSYKLMRIATNISPCSYNDTLFHDKLDVVNLFVKNSNENRKTTTNLIR